MLAAGMTFPVAVSTATSAGITQVTIQIEHERRHRRALLSSNNLHASAHQCVAGSLTNSTTYNYVRSQAS